MKLIHISDLHLGKRLNEYSLIDDQKYILSKIIEVIDAEKPDGVIIAGDVYDKSVPSVEAVQLFDDFLTRLASRKLKVFVISGNHDSAERISFGSHLMEESGIYISQVYNGEVKPLSFDDEYGKINIYLLPFIKPAHVRRYTDDVIETYTDAIACAIAKMDVNTEERNILVTHQFVTGASRCDSEDISVGGTDNVDVSVFEPFDYVALGHIHRPQSCSYETVRYSGTPLKYSFSEANDEKSVTVVELKEKDNIGINLIPITPLRDLVEIKGKYDELMLKSFYEGTSYQTDYVHITLTDEDDVVDAIGRLRTVYHNIMRLDYDNKRTRGASLVEAVSDIEEKTPFQLFADLYELQNNQPMSNEQESFVKKLIEDIWEDEK